MTVRAVVPWPLLSNSYMEVKVCCEIENNHMHSFLTLALITKTVVSRLAPYGINGRYIDPSIPDLNLHGPLNREVGTGAKNGDPEPGLQKPGATPWGRGRYTSLRRSCRQISHTMSQGDFRLMSGFGVFIWLRRPC